MSKRGDEPVSPWKIGTTVFRGLSKREWFAGMALQGLIAADTRENLRPGSAGKVAVYFADAALKALEESEDGDE